MHHAILRRTDVDALKLILGRDLLFNEFGGLAANVGEILPVLGAHVLIDLQHLDLRFGDLALGLRDGCHKLSALAFKARLLALKCSHAIELDELLGPKLAHAFQFFLDPLDLLVLGCDLRHQTADLFLGLRYALAELTLEALAGLAPDLEKPRLADKHALDLGVAAARLEIARKRDAFQAVDFGLLARLARGKFVEPLDHNLQVGAGLGIVELDHNIARLDDVAVAHAQFGDDSTGGVLHLLHVRVDNELALRNHRASELAGRGPSADAANEQDRHDNSRYQMRPDRSACVHDVAAPASPTRRNPPPAAAAAAAAAAGGDAAGGLKSFAKTSSRGPSAWGRPFNIAST